MVQQSILPPKAVVAPEGLNAQQVHGQDLGDHFLMGLANRIVAVGLPQQAGMFQQSGVHALKSTDQGGAIRSAGQDHHHHPAAEYPDNDLADAGLSNIPQLGDIQNIDHRKGNDCGSVTRQLKGIGDVIGKVGAGPGTDPEPRRHAEQKQPRIVQGMPGDNQRRGGPQQAAHHAAQAFTDHPANRREADHRRRGHRPVGFIQIQAISDGQRQAHRDPVAQGIAPLGRGCLYPRQVTPGKSGHLHGRVPIATLQVVPETRVRSAGSWSKVMRTGMRCASRTHGIVGFTSGTSPESVSTL
ncbi:hypothetical protein D3C75_488570 [compost metagenome]